MYAYKIQTPGNYPEESTQRKCVKKKRLQYVHFGKKTLRISVLPFIVELRFLITST